MEGKVERKGEGESKGKRGRSPSPTRAVLPAVLARPLTPQESFAEYFEEKTRDIKEAFEEAGMWNAIKLKYKTISAALGRQNLDWAKAQLDGAVAHVLLNIDPKVIADNESRFKRQAQEHERAQALAALQAEADARDLAAFKRDSQRDFDAVAARINARDIDVIGVIDVSGARKHWNDPGVGIRDDHELVARFLAALRSSGASCSGRSPLNRDTPTFSVGAIGARAFNYIFSFNAVTGRLGLFHAGPGG